MVRDVASRRLGTSENSPSRIFLVQEYLQQIKTPAVPICTAGVLYWIAEGNPAPGNPETAGGRYFPGDYMTRFSMRPL